MVFFGEFYSLNGCDVLVDWIGDVRERVKDDFEVWGLKNYVIYDIIY